MLVALAGISYTSLVMSQLREGREHSVRLLEKAASLLEDVLDNAHSTVGSLARDSRFACDFDQRQPYLSFSRPSNCKDVEKLLAQSPAHGRSYLLPARDGLALKWQAGGGTTDKATEIVFSVEIDRILDDVPLERAFDLLVIADHDGNVVYRPPEHGAGLRLENLESLGSADSRDGSSDDKRASSDTGSLSMDSLGVSRVLDVLLAGRPYHLYSQPLSFSYGTAVPESARGWVICGFTDAGTSVKRALLVSRRLALVLGLFLLFGLVTSPLIKLAFLQRKERFRLTDCYLLLLSTLGTLLLGTIMALDADSYLGLRRSSRDALENLARGLDRHFSEELVRLHDQLQLYDRYLAETDGRVENTEDLLTGVNLLRSPAALQRPDPAGESPPVAPGDGSRQIRFPEPRCYPYFSSVFWMDHDGLQFVKGTVRDRNTPRVNLYRRSEPRQYFVRIKERTWWTYGRHLEDEDAHCAPTRRTRSFFVQPFRSITTGERSTALSTLSGLTRLQREQLGTASTLAPPQPGPIVAAAISTAPISLSDPVLPLGFGFAVLEPQEGKVLYHSDERRALTERLLDELGDPDRLHSALLSRSPRHFRTTYLARPHQMYVRPLTGLPWWVVAFRDDEVVNTVNLEAVADAVILAAAYAFLFLLVLTILLVLARGRQALRPTWMWPTPEKHRTYRLLCATYALLAVVLSAALLLLPGRSALLASVLVPAVAAAVAWLSFRRTGDARSESSSQRYRKWYYLSALLMWVVAAILPAAGFFKAAWEGHRQQLLKAEDLHLMEQIDARNRRIAGEYRRFAEQQLDRLRENGLETASREVEVRIRFQELERRRRKQTLDLYLSSDVCRSRPAGIDLEDGKPCRPRAAGGGRLEVAWPQFTRLLARYKPFYGDTSKRLRYLETQVAARSWFWQDGKVSFVRHAANGDDDVELESFVSSFDPDLGPACVLGGAALLAALAIWNLYCGRNIFFAEIDKPRSLELSELVEGSPARNVVAVLTSPEARRRLLAAPQYLRFDLASAALPVSTPKPVVCDHFEDGLDDPAVRARKLKSLEQLVLDRSRRVVIPSAVDPLPKLTRPEVADQDDTGDEGESLAGIGRDEARRWGRLLSSFEIAPVSLKEDAATAAPHRHWLKRELEADPNLASLVPGDAETSGDQAADSPEEAPERLLEALAGYYTALWTACSEEEQLVLVQLAEEQFVNPRQSATVRRLMQRGLVVKDPALRLMNESFTLFVKRVQVPANVTSWERETEGIGWMHVRWAFLGILVTIAVFLFATQRDLFDRTIGFVTALTVAVPSMLNLVRSWTLKDS